VGTSLTLLSSQDGKFERLRWVRQTSDKLFRNLTTIERWLLQMIFRKEFNWVQISAMLQCSTQTARQQYNDVMKYLRGHVGVPEAIAA